MNFTREPIIETIITPKEGYKLVIRNSKGVGQEEFFVDAIEVISFGHAYFYRSVEKPKSFLVPITDYEIVEVRETRVVLKTPGLEKGIKIGGGREASLKAPREAKEQEEISSDKSSEIETPLLVSEQQGEKRREKKRFRKRRGKADHEEEEAEVLEAPFSEELLSDEESKPQSVSEEPKPEPKQEISKPREERATLIPPPPTLISETLARYKDTPVYASAFYEKKEEPVIEEAEGSETLLDSDVTEQMAFTPDTGDTDSSEKNEETP